MSYYPTGNDALSAYEGHWPVGTWFQPEGSANTTQAAADRNYFVPIWIPERRTLSAMSIDMTTSAVGAGSVFRLGIYDADVNGIPRNLLLDAGTVDSTVAAGILQKTGLSLPLNRGLIYATAVSQIALTQPFFRFAGGFNRWILPTTNATPTPNRSCYYETGVAGALPAVATPNRTVLTIPGPALDLLAA